MHNYSKGWVRQYFNQKVVKLENCTRSSAALLPDPKRSTKGEVQPTPPTSEEVVTSFGLFRFPVSRSETTKQRTETEKNLPTRN
ncbi:hypothetical protein ZHAS_00017019 [Anopheles sinensis]|uniref:Uncharacterized protein n=1 Tax=Anopheles sinensis TaxID=74873 RepID=A0A084WFL7_ANOSI|nr:hypothetical protein ZHAS_00017019 [Anopheles sinensis]